jgi:hypothetical protein
MLITPQIRSESIWIPVQDVCSAPDLKSVKETFIFMFITDFILLVTMLIGLLRLRYCGAGTCGLGRLLWKQVRWRGFFHGPSFLFALM